MSLGFVIGLHLLSTSTSQAASSGWRLVLEPAATEIVLREPLFVTLSLHNDGNRLNSTPHHPRYDVMFLARREGGPFEVIGYGHYKLGVYNQVKVNPGQFVRWDELLFWGFPLATLRLRQERSLWGGFHTLPSAVLP